ncbi:hypothetical protein GCM10009798_10580 [Nocardioides panacihumi]|uniref:Helix-turn-helix domain-containing protein n=1 Tax=Nocardioides panacihumi TaxID=400774 RepID=A0ABN2QJ07_9ACTN
MTVAVTPRVVSLAQAATMLSVSTRTVRRYVDSGHLEAIRIGTKTLRIRVESLQRMLDGTQA